MFERRKCPSCGEGVKAGWAFCPHCGTGLRVKVRPARDLFAGLFEDIHREFERIDRLFGRDFFKFPTPFRGGGVSVTITSGTGREPRVDVKTFGEYKKFEPEIRRRFGLEKPVREVEERPPRPIPRVTEEPEARVERLADRDVITIKLPGVTDEADVEIRKLEQSVEIKAFAGDKAYFKLIPIKPTSHILSKSLENETLRIEIGR
jgi:HSP20 family molecular chaperone IbpA